MNKFSVLILAVLSFSAFSASAAITERVGLACVFTEPFLSYTLQAKNSTGRVDFEAIKVGDDVFADVAGEEVVAGSVTAALYGTRFITYTFKTGKTVTKLTVDRYTPGSDGMSETVYAFEGHLDGDLGHYGGCSFFVSYSK